MEIFILLKVIFLLLIINLAECAQWITWEEALEAAGEDDQGGGGGGGEPPVSLNLTSVSCPCNKLLLSSLGPAATVLPQVMGTYTR